MKYRFNFLKIIQRDKEACRLDFLFLRKTAKGRSYA